MAIPRCHPGPAFPAGHRLGRQQSDEAGLGDPGAEDGYRLQITAQGLHSSHGSGQPILFARLPKDPATTRVQRVDERQGKLL